MKVCNLILLLLPLQLFAQLSVAPVFSSNMVLQRNKPIHVWGKAKPGEVIAVSFVGKNKSTICLKDSSWIITFPSLPANSHPIELVVNSSTTKISFSNILIGDVWLCIGQSNMEWPMQREKHFAEEIQHANKPLLRFLNPTYPGKNIYGSTFTDSVIHQLTPQTFYKGTWQVSDSLSIKNMSAVAYYFGKMISKEKNVPIGLINISIGGAPLETFINPKALAADKQFAKKNQGDWLENESLPVWIRERGRQNVGSLSNVPTDTQGKNHAYKPGFAYISGIEPLTNFPISGILNYQGESNAQEIERVNEYAWLSKLMIEDFRKQWKDPKLPYYFVQLSSIDTLKYKGQLWPLFRNIQRTILDIVPFSGMAVCSDAGAQHDVHPTNKKIVGERLARWAISSIPSGPLPTRAYWKDEYVIVEFTYIGKGLKTLDDLAIKGFSIDGKNEENASLSADRKTIRISSKQKPASIYYGWKPFSDGNLCNSEILPASTFTIPVQ